MINQFDSKGLSINTAPLYYLKGVRVGIIVRHPKYLLKEKIPTEL